MGGAEVAAAAAAAAEPSQQDHNNNNIFTPSPLAREPLRWLMGNDLLDALQR